MSRDVEVIVFGDGEYQTTEDETDQIIYGCQEYSHTVPAGFNTNFASIPWLLQWIYKPTEKWLIRASLHHDYWYRYQTMSREAADGHFKHLCKQNGATHLQRTLVWLSVALAGDAAYRKGNINDEKEIN